MPRTLKSVVPALVFVCFVVCAPDTAQASLDLKYEKTAASGAVSAEQTAAKTVTQSKKQPLAQSGTGNGTVAATFKLPQKYINAMKKEHARFCEAYAEAEMGLRYFFKTGYDADRGKKPPTKEEIEAMRFVIKLQTKDLASSARRYASNIRLARIAMMNMTPEEQAMFATALGQMLGTPACAETRSLATSMAGFENALSNTAVKSETVSLGMGNINPGDYTTIHETIKDTYDSFAASHAANVLATGAKLVTGTILSVSGFITGAAMAGAAAPAVAATGCVIAIGSLIGGGFEFVSSACGFIDAYEGKETNSKDLKLADDISKWTSIPVTIVSPTKGLAEIITNALGGTKDFWIDWIMKADDPDTPGAKGAKDVKKAKDSAGGGGGGNGGGGGSGGGGGGGCGGGCGG